MQKVSDEDMEVAAKVRELKKTFKSLSKNQLIDLLLRQVGISIDQQNINKIIMEENMELKKGAKNE